MKKLAVLFSLLLLLTGCGKVSKENVIKDFSSKINNSKSYKLKGSMEIVNNEETFNYSLEAYYLKDNYYKVILVNQTNNHEQIILRNEEGVYVVTPSLNKSFKFQSEWPFNSSQAYILASLVSDIKNDDTASLEEKDDNYIITTKVNYPNNTELTSQKIYLDKKMNIEAVEVYNNSNIVKIKVNFTSVNLKAGLDKEDFILDDLIDDDCCATNSCESDKCENNNPNKTDENKNNNESTDNQENETKESSNILDIIYPLYIPSETYLKSSEKINTDSGERVILTFSGEKDFVLIEEQASKSKEFEIIPVYGDPTMVADTVAALSANSLSWNSNFVDYYLASNNLSPEEMLTIASSLGGTTMVIGSK